MANKLTSGLGFIYDPHLTMTAKSKNQKKTTKKDHYTAILLEEVRDQFKFVVEKVDGMEESLRTEMAQNKADLKQDIADTRQAITLRIENVKTELKQEIQGVRTELKQEIQGVRTELKQEIQGMRTELKQEIQGVQTELSKKIDQTHELVLRHDQEIASLKKSA